VFEGRETTSNGDEGEKRRFCAGENGTVSAEMGIDEKQQALAETKENLLRPRSFNRDARIETESYRSPLPSLSPFLPQTTTTTTTNKQTISLYHTNNGRSCFISLKNFLTFVLLFYRLDFSFFWGPRTPSPPFGLFAFSESLPRTITITIISVHSPPASLPFLLGMTSPSAPPTSLSSSAKAKIDDILLKAVDPFGGPSHVPPYFFKALTADGELYSKGVGKVGDGAEINGDVVLRIFSNTKLVTSVSQSEKGRGRRGDGNDGAVSEQCFASSPSLQRPRESRALQIVQRRTLWCHAQLWRSWERWGRIRREGRGGIELALCFPFRPSPSAPRPDLSSLLWITSDRGSSGDRTRTRLSRYGCRNHPSWPCSTSDSHWVLGGRGTSVRRREKQGYSKTPLEPLFWTLTSLVLSW